MGELTPREVQARFGALVGELDIGQDNEAPPGCGHPAILVRRLTKDSDGLAGMRARLLLATFDEHRQLVGHGWRTDVRILSTAPAEVDGVIEAGVLVIDEAGFYSDDRSSAVTVDCSQLWSEELVRVRADRVEAAPYGAWLRGVLDDPNEPVVEPLHPVAGRPHLIGSRLIRDLGGGRFETNLRAISPVQMTDKGLLAVAVMSERSWYRWSSPRDACAPEIGHVLAEDLWVE